MAKELMEIGGFITSGAEIVNHDSTLSGNGTVDSPLGVVPGYNETVLFDAGLVSNHTSAATLSEPLSGFDKIEVRMVRGDTNYSECPTILYFEPRRTLTAVQVNWSVGQNGWYLVNQKLTWDDTHLYVNAAHALYGGSFATGTLNQETNTDLIRKTIVKVVGINRIANN